MYRILNKAIDTQVLKLDEEGDGKDGDPFTRLLNTLVCNRVQIID